MIEKSFTRYIIQKHFIELFMRLHIFSVGRKVCHTKHVVLRFAVDDLRIKKFKKTTSFLNRKLILLEKCSQTEFTTLEILESLQLNFNVSDGERRRSCSRPIIHDARRD